MTPSANVGVAVPNLETRTSAAAPPPVSRDGLVLYADAPSGVPTETFARMRATTFGAAATANAELSRESPVQIVSEGNGSTTITADGGSIGLRVVVLDPGADRPNLLGRSTERPREPRRPGRDWRTRKPEPVHARPDGILPVSQDKTRVTVIAPTAI